MREALWTQGFYSSVFLTTHNDPISKSRISGVLGGGDNMYVALEKKKPDSFD